MPSFLRRASIHATSFLCFSLAVTAHAQPQAFALLSPSAVAHVHSLRNTEPAHQAIAIADAHLSLPPSPMPRIHTEGTLPHHGIRDQSIAAEQDFDTMAAFAFAYRLTGKRKYLDATSRYLDAWASIYHPSFNPIDETRFDPVFIAFDLTRADLPAKTTQDTLALFNVMAQGYESWWASSAAHDKANWSSHRIKLMTLAALETGDPNLIETAARDFRQQLQQNILPDGQVVDFAKRDALHYVVYDLEPLVTAAVAAHMHGHDWFHTAAIGKPSLQMAVDWLLPYAFGQKTHEEFVHSHVGFDAARAKVGEPGFTGLWHPANSYTLLLLTAWDDPTWLPAAKRVQQTAGGQAPLWLRLAMLASPPR